MDQTKVSSSKYDPKWLYIAASVLTLLTISVSIWEHYHPVKAPSLIRWRTPQDGKQEAARTGHPVMYVFSAEWCGPCKQLENTVFIRQDVAKAINNDFIPVHVIDRKQEEGDNPPEIKRLQKLCDVEGFPTMVVVPANLLDAKTDDVYSIGNSIEQRMVLGAYGWPFRSDEEVGGFDEWLESSHRRLPALVGFNNAQSVLKYLYEARLWHKLPRSKGAVHWQPMSALSTSSKEPKLIAFVEDCGSLSDNMRRQLFEDSDSSELIDENFVPVLVELNRGNTNGNPTGEALKLKYGIKSLPAIVVVRDGAQPQIENGFSSRDSTREFLKRSLKN